ncbi:uncharacterized protein BO66DRAFT_432971 [Aspergillus aculeatinus CBS 121060]|uniref:Uncharacterized protein n=1 Tax=Aspergillus aculeatinus CBS 121060 TaxID=1448322 RepID=A0ACD1GS14_9EURO|nr:hypothetical protein BO66DRAFT_432971 [Aspergillus aculeatinus CBS 121060]RAH64073.1 hypothetical protein BO66DRAFT_432971 [Aspergillus aculeatinus CBS 121060]
MVVDAGDNELLFQNLLGSAVNILERPNIFDIDDVLKHRKYHVILDLAATTKKVSVPGIEEKVSIRDNVELVSNGNGTRINDVEVQTGSELVDSLKADASAKGKYAAMSVEVGGGYSYETTLDKSSMYALMSIEQSQFYTYLHIARGKELASLNADFLAAVDELPDFAENDETAMQKYRVFFNTYGTHVIRRCQYGCRFSLEVQTRNAAFKSKEEYRANVNAEFGENFGASASFEKTSTFSEYQKERRTASSVTGGDRGSSLILQRQPGDKQLFEEWAKSINEVKSSAVTGVEVEALGTLLSRSGVPRGDDLTKALKCLTLGPESEPITVHGILYSESPKISNYLTFQCWGDGFSDFELTALGGGQVKDSEDSDSPAKCLFGQPSLAAVASGITAYGPRNFAALVKISGVTGKQFSAGIYMPSGEGGIRLTLYPPNGPIEILFDKSQNWNSCTIPSLIASGKYTSD